MTDRPTLTERIGGRWAVSLRGWIVISAIMMVPQIAYGIATYRDAVDQVAIVGIVIAGVTSLGLVLLLADRTLLRQRRVTPVPIVTIVVLGVIAGLIQATITYALLLAFGLDTIALQGRFVIAPVFATILIVAVALVFDDLDRYQRERHELLQRLAGLRALDAERGELTRSIETAVQEDVLVTTREILGDLDRARTARSAEERLRVARQLQTTAERSLRPLSQRLYAPGISTVPDATRREALRSALNRQPIRALAVTIAVGVATFAFSASRTDALEGLWQAIVQMLVLYVALVTTTWVARRRAWTPAWTLPIATLVGVTVTTVKVAVIQELRFGSLLGGVVILNAVWVAIATIAVSIVAAAVSGRRDELRELEFTVDERVLDAIIANRELVRVSRELAQHVHGTLQSTLLATAFAIESATRSNDQVAFTTAVDGAREALRSVTPLHRPADDLAGEVQRQLDLWREFTEVRATVDVTGTIPEATIRDAGQVIEEGIGNAKKHGRAQTIEVLITQPADGLLRIVVRDDGRGPQAGGAGFGTTLLDGIAPGAWTLNPRPEGPGAELTLELRYLAAATR